MPSFSGLTVLAITALLACGRAAPRAGSTALAASNWDPKRYRVAVDDGLETIHAANPPIATLLGDHRFDDAWPDLTEEGEARVAASFHAHAERLRALAAASPDTVADAQLADAGTDRPALDARVLADRLDGLRETARAIRPTEKDPSAVLMTIGIGIDRILAHPYAPLHARMDALVARLAKVPALLATARARLDRPRRAGLELAPIMAKGLVVLLGSDATHLTPGELDGDAALVTALRQAAEEAARAIDAYQRDLATRFSAETAEAQPIGAEAWGRIARLMEGVTQSPAEVKQLGEDEIVRLRGELDRLVATAGKPGETREAFLARMAADRPEPESVLAEYRESARRVETWLRQAAFVTVPWTETKLEIAISPPHLRASTMASLNQAGVLDANSDARFEVNVPTSDMPEPMQKALSAFHTRGAMDLVSIHEGLPGHYLQLLLFRKQRSMVRKLVWSFSSLEGWAHYCEEAVLDAGFASDRDPVRARTYALRLALQRAARVVVDVGESDGSLTLDEGAKRMEIDGLLAPATARMEALRAMVRPVNMFAYLYGKLAIKRLRDVVKAREGARFSLQSFHDRLLSLGGLSIADLGTAAFGVN